MSDRGGATENVQSVVRGSNGHSVVRTGRLTINLDARRVEVAGRRVHLTPKEYQVLELLSLRKGTCLAKKTFMNYLYDDRERPWPKIIDVFICKLRKKLAALGGTEYIETLWGGGYMLRDRPSEDSAQMLNGVVHNASRLYTGS